MTTLAEAVLKVFQCTIADAHVAGRRNDEAARLKFFELAFALEEAYPREVRPAYDMAGISPDDSSPAPI